MGNNDTREGTAYAARAALGGARISVRALAQQTGRSHAYWTRRLHGEQPFTTDDLDALAGVCGVAVADLLGRAA
jgi:transcriptional regulator with XRE-family HTH domain